MSVLGFLKSSVNRFTQVSENNPLPVILQANPLPVVLKAANADGISALALSAASSSSNGSDLVNEDYKAANIIVDITAISGTTPTLTIDVEGKDPVSGKYYTILESAALSSVSTTVLSVGPGLPVTANLSANAILPKTWRVTATIGGGTPSVTATIGVSYAK
jgi:hypothetical protein